jgi:hypothetical protein
MPSDKIITEFKNGKKISKYPGGVVKEQTKEELERYKQYLVNEKQRIERHISLIDDDLKNMTV